jgi:hypothetical protein
MLNHQTSGMKLDLGVREFERDTLALGQWFAEPVVFE